jgi:hypothetical protein
MGRCFTRKGRGDLKGSNGDCKRLQTIGTDTERFPKSNPPNLSHLEKWGRFGISAHWHTLLDRRVSKIQLDFQLTTNEVMLCQVSYRVETGEAEAVGDVSRFD